ncbi:hypothetical protein Tco_1380186, partial [Tanacetum coccineum]
GRTPEVSTNSVASDIPNNNDTPSSTTIIVDKDESPLIVSTSNEPTTPQSSDLAVNNKKH